MRKISALTLLFSSVYSQAQNQEVQSVIETFFQAFHARDSLQLHLLCDDTMIMQSITENEKGTLLSHEKPEAFYKAIASIPADLKFQEKILSYSIQADGVMAHVWTPYEFYINDKLSHKGVNAFTLFKKEKQWRIIHLIDTRRK